MKIFILLISITFMVSCIRKDDSNIIIASSNIQSKDTIKAYYFIDGKHVPDKNLEKVFTDHELDWVFWAAGPRKSILLYGEKYRKGIYGLKTAKKDD